MAESYPPSFFQRLLRKGPYEPQNGGYGAIDEGLLEAAALQEGFELGVASPEGAEGIQRVPAVPA